MHRDLIQIQNKLFHISVSLRVLDINLKEYFLIFTLTLRKMICFFTNSNECSIRKFKKSLKNKS